MSGFFDYSHLEMRYEPYPIGLAKPIIAEDVYNEMLDNWPDTDQFKHMTELGHKYALSEKFNASQYHAFIRSRPIWTEFHRWIKSDDFLKGVMGALQERNIDLGYRGRVAPMKRAVKTVKGILRGRPPVRGAKLSARFEFQMMPADGGHILPHTDTPAKIVTLVISMQRPGEWDPAWGGSTDIDRPKDMTQVYNELNEQHPFEDVEKVDGYAFTPNQAVVFIKTFNSWHSVRPMQGQGSDAKRKTLIINIEVPK